MHAYLLNLKLLMKIMAHNKKTKQGRIMQEIYVYHGMGGVTIRNRRRKTSRVKQVHQLFLLTFYALTIF